MIHETRGSISVTDAFAQATLPLGKRCNILIHSIDFQVSSWAIAADSWVHFQLTTASKGDKVYIIDPTCIFNYTKRVSAAGGTQSQLTWYWEFRVPIKANIMDQALYFGIKTNAVGASVGYCRVRFSIQGEPV